MSQLQENNQHENKQTINVDNLKSNIQNQYQQQRLQNDSIRNDYKIRKKPHVQVLLQMQKNQDVERDKFQTQTQQLVLVHVDDQQQQDTHQTSNQLTHNIYIQHHQIREERLWKIVPPLFSMGCKIRSKMVKGKTFDQIQDQLKFMDLEKFVNFCTDFQIHKLFPRQILIETFKKYALNRLTLDINRFSKVIKKLLQKNSSLLTLLLQSEQIIKTHINKTKFQQILTERQTTLSKYNYKLRPINGKDIQAIEQDLKEKKQIKELIRKEKQQSMILRKKQGILTNNDNNKRKIPKNNTISESKLGVLGLNQISKMARRPNKHRNYSQKFNPESLVTNIIINGDDKYLQEYQSRIWKKDSDVTAYISNNKSLTTNESILETALSKRIEKGNNVIKKITSSYLKNYG